jgi:hypothetical protein
MTKKTEALRINPFHEDKLYDRIADTYFHPKTRHKTRKKKANIVLKFLKGAAIGIASAALVVIVVLAGTTLYQSYCLNALKGKVAGARVVIIANGGEVNNEIMKNTEFRGYAKGVSSFSKDCIFLKNTKKYNWANLSLNFKFPLDLSKRRLSMMIKGKMGGEKVSLVLKDIYNRSLRLSDMSLASSWKEESIALADSRKDIDLSKITHMRFEYGYIGESPKEMDSPIDINVYLKDIKITKET